MHPELIKDIENLNALSKEEKYDKIGFSELLDDNKTINIPENIKHIKIDIGLSMSAPNAALWLCETDDRMVFGFEPSDMCFEALQRGLYGRKHTIGEEIYSFNEDQASICIDEGVIYKHNKVIESNISYRFKAIRCALDNVGKDNLHFVPFFLTPGDFGCSSLSMPTEILLDKITHRKEDLRVGPVGVMSFYDFLEKIPWDRFEFIEQVKIDTQGRDLDILKSCEEYIHKIVFLQVENSTSGEYHHSHTREEIYQFLIDNDFVHISTIDVDSNYINKRYVHLIDDLHCSVV